MFYWTKPLSVGLVYNASALTSFEPVDLVDVFFPL